jgi:outer membrane immunogenic protein
MRKVFGLVGASLLVAAPAFAADLAVKAPVYKAPPPPVFTWTGFYVGGNVGWAGGGGATSFAPGTAFTNQFFAANEFPTSLSSSPSAVMGGGQIGYNWQITQWVLGAEADIQGSGYKGTSTVTPVPTGFAPFTTSVSEKNDWFGTVRARLGYLITPSLLVYGSGGLAYGETETSFNTAGTGLTVCPGNFTCASGSAQTTRVGWAAGGGLEYMFLRGWSVKAEYLRVDLGSQSVTAASTQVPAASFTATTKFEENIARAGVNYHF